MPGLEPSFPGDMIMSSESAFGGTIGLFVATTKTLCLVKPFRAGRYDELPVNDKPVRVSFAILAEDIISDSATIVDVLGSTSKAIANSPRNRIPIPDTA